MLSSAQTVVVICGLNQLFWPQLACMGCHHWPDQSTPNARRVAKDDLSAFVLRQSQQPNCRFLFINFSSTTPTLLLVSLFVILAVLYLDVSRNTVAVHGFPLNSVLEVERGRELVASCRVIWSRQLFLPLNYNMY